MSTTTREAKIEAIEASLRESDDRLWRLRNEAAEAGDYDQVNLCDQAMNGRGSGVRAAAIRACAEAILDARDAAGGSTAEAQAEFRAEAILEWGALTEVGGADKLGQPYLQSYIEDSDYGIIGAGDSWDAVVCGPNGQAATFCETVGAPLVVAMRCAERHARYAWEEQAANC